MRAPFLVPVRSPCPSGASPARFADRSLLSFVDRSVVPDSPAVPASDPVSVVAGPARCWISSSCLRRRDLDSCGPVGMTGAGDGGGAPAGNPARPAPVAAGLRGGRQRALSAPAAVPLQEHSLRGRQLLTLWHSLGHVRVLFLLLGLVRGGLPGGVAPVAPEELLQAGEEAAEVVGVGGAPPAGAVAGDSGQVALLHQRLLVAVEHLGADPGAPAHLAQAGVGEGIRPAVGQDVPDEPHLLGGEAQLGLVVVEGGGDGRDPAGEDGGPEAGQEAVAGVGVATPRPWPRLLGPPSPVTGTRQPVDDGAPPACVLRALRRPARPAPASGSGAPLWPGAPAPTRGRLGGQLARTAL